MRYEKKGTCKQLALALVVFLVITITSVLCYSVFSEKKMEQFIYYFLVRLLLFPAMFLSFGNFLAKAVNHFWGTTSKISERSSRCVKILALVLIGLNVIFIAPYAFGYMKAVVQAVSGDGIALNFPYISIYSETANFFHNVMYKVPVVYTVLGFCLGAFSIQKRGILQQ